MAGEGRRHFQCIFQEVICWISTQIINTTGPILICYHWFPCKLVIQNTGNSTRSFNGISSGHCTCISYLSHDVNTAVLMLNWLQIIMQNNNVPLNRKVKAILSSAHFHCHTSYDQDLSQRSKMWHITTSFTGWDNVPVYASASVFHRQ